MKKKLFVFSIVLMLCSYKIEHFIYNIKNKIINKKITDQDNDKTILVDKKNQYINAVIIENQWHTLVINKGSRHGIKINKMVRGNEGFIGIINDVQEEYSTIKTFWYANWPLIIIDGLNNYGTLKSNGYFLTMSSKNIFQDGQEIFITDSSGVMSMGYVKKWNKFFYKILPKENILNTKNVFIKK